MNCPSQNLDHPEHHRIVASNDRVALSDACGVRLAQTRLCHEAESHPWHEEPTN